MTANLPAFAITLVLASSPIAATAEPIARHPRNPHYLVYQGRPTILVGSGEHYGAVLNLDFDWKRYLDTLAADGLNLTRLWVGSYYEKPGDFGIQNNTLAPAPGRAITPLARSDTPGAADGGAKFDLARWNDAYFDCLRGFVAEAGKRGVVVEVVLFSAYYRSAWSLSPLNSENNVNGVGGVPKEKANTLDNGNLLEAQERVARKIVRELRGADNVYFEIQNEPYADHALPAATMSFSILPQDLAGPGSAWKNRVGLAKPESLAWQARIAAAIMDEEKGGPRHLIAQNYGNFGYPLRDVGANIDILNFHYAWPEAATLNLGLGRVVGFDETGFANASDKSAAPETDAVYRKQAWQFLMSGGGIFSMLDYSFAVGREDGTLANTAPGGGSPALRRQLRVLRNFLHGLDIPALRPRPDVVTSAPGAYTRALGAETALAVYVSGDGQTDLTLELPRGRWRAEWIDTLTGQAAPQETFVHRGGPVTLKSPRYERDVALRVVLLR